MHKALALDNAPFDIKGAAVEIGGSKDTVRRLIAKGEIKSFRIGNRHRIEREEIKRFKARGGSQR